MGTYLVRSSFTGKISGLVLLLAAHLGGCATDGGLAQASLRPECAADDSLCLAEGLNAPIAVGSQLPLDVELTFSGSSAPPFALRSANTNIFEVSDSVLDARSEGVAALLVNSDDGKLAFDFVHLWFKEPTAVRLQRVDASRRSDLRDSVELVVGQSITLAALLAQGSQPLLGDFETTWTAEGAALSVLRTGVRTQRAVVARAVGDTNLQVSALGLNASLTIRVLP